MRTAAVITFLSMVLIALPATALPGVSSNLVVDRGIDVWWTPADGSTRADFQADPIPAGFFCEDASAFSGSILFRGAPIATEPAGILAGADTVVLRLDDVAFQGAGVGETRVQVAALNLISMYPIETRCGSFDVRATLVGEQPITRMEITYDGIQGGTYSAPLDLVVRLAFTPISDRASGARELIKRIPFDPADNATWSEAAPGRVRHAAGHVLVDTDGDNRADTLLPGTTDGFFPGTFEGNRPGSITCHYYQVNHQHCYEDCNNSSTYACP